MTIKEKLELVKKTLYKENTIATKLKDNDGNNNSVYETPTTLGAVQFIIPFKEQTDGEGNQKLFEQYMPAKHLARWISLDTSTLYLSE